MSNRREQRFPCVGIELMYSPVRNDVVEELGSQLYSAVGHDMSYSGLSFDVVKPMSMEERIYIIVHNQFQPPERLTAEVRWCKTLENNLYRIGVVIIASAGIALDTESNNNEFINSVENRSPSEAMLICPSCLEAATFNFIRNQEGNWKNGIMPLYQCSECGTTRSIPNILEFNRRKRINELRSNKTMFDLNQQQIRNAADLKRILYVEDEPDILTIAQMALEMVGGFELEVCRSGREALEKASQFKPDLFLLDVMMPELTGPQTLIALREQTEFASTPAIFMTAKIQTHEIAEYKADNVLGVIPKPFEPMALSSEVMALWKGNNNET